ncbi:MAG: hypothetical protein IKZ95_08115 [Lachnospiraceae bacterium]|nr:hypothetical protein [Lachnospiraceae bacterium]
MKKRVVTIVLALCLIGILTGCRSGLGIKGTNGIGKKAVDNESGVNTFFYSYNASIGADSYSYSVVEKDGKHFLEYESMVYQDYGTMTMELDEAFLDQLTKLYKDCRLAEWDGYDKYATNVLDGDGFSLSLSFRDGESMSAHGSNCAPEGYGTFKEQMEALFTPLAETLLEEARQQQIAEGFPGKLDFIMAYFKQKGDSGSDSYDIFITQPGVRDNNFDVKITSKSGEFIEPGEYQYYTAMDVSQIDFAGVQELIEKYDLIQWYNYDEAAEDYNNSEWFQISFGFDDGKTLNACGTEHPEHYEEFRKEFLELIVKMTKNAEQ